MDELIVSRSSLTSLVANGRFRHLLTPWHISVDLRENAITVKKRNWFLIGFDTETYAFKYVRNVRIDTHLFGADLCISIIGGSAEVLSLPKRDAQRIRDMLLTSNKNTADDSVIVH